MTVLEAMGEATKLAQSGQWQMRSCWNCNPAHEHLKDAGLIMCFDCGRWFYNGIDVTIYDDEQAKDGDAQC